MIGSNVQLSNYGNVGAHVTYLSTSKLCAVLVIGFNDPKVVPASVRGAAGYSSYLRTQDSEREVCRRRLYYYH